VAPEQVPYFHESGQHLVLEFFKRTARTVPRDTLRRSGRFAIILQDSGWVSFLSSVKKSLESTYPRPQDVALWPIHGFATAISLKKTCG
jgi:hypothetical protein